MRIGRSQLSLALCASSVVIGGSVSGCSAAHESTANGQGALHASFQDNILYPVGYIGSTTREGCTLTLIAPDLAVTAAHCMPSAAFRCTSPNGAFLGGAGSYRGTQMIQFSSTGRSQDAVSFPVDGVAFHPSALPNLRACGTNAKHTCSTLSGEREAVTNASDDRAHDIALVHIGRGVFPSPNANQLPSEYGIVPAKIVTSISDSSPTNVVGRHASFVVHGNGVPRAFDVAGGAKPTIVGWGFNNVSAGASAADRTVRYSGPAEFVYGAAYMGLCVGPWECNDKPIALGSCSSGLNSLSDGRWLPTLNLRRASINSSFDGPVIDGGDSGSPAIVYGGTSVGAVPELPDDGTPYVLGALFGGDIGGGQGVVPPTGVPANFTYAPTFTRGTDAKGNPENGAWLDERFTDFDGDSTPDYADNCPWLANHSQEDTNLIAEHALFDGASPCADTTKPPTSGDSAACVDYYRAHFAGDACDYDSVSRSQPYTAPTDALGTCQNVQATPMGGYTMGGTSSCPQFVNTAVRWSSRAGNLRGYELPGSDTTEPTFCKCISAGGPNDSDCQNPQGAFKCNVAQDDKFPAPDGAGVGGANWKRITRYTAPSSNILFPKATTTHQYINDPALSSGAYDPSLEVSGIWSWPRDNATFGEPNNSPGYAGVLWSHVFPEDFARGDTDPQPFFFDRQRAPLQHLGNEYLSLTTRSEGWNVVEVPVNGPNYWKWWLWGELSSSTVLSPIVKVLSNGGANTLVMQRAGDGVTIVNARLTSAAVSALAPVASGSRQLVLGDDVIGRSTRFGNLPPAVLLAPNSMSIRGALLSNGWWVDAVTAAHPQEGQIVTLATYAMRENAVFGLVNVGGDWKLRRSDVGRALYSEPDVTEITFKVKDPRAMAWSDAERAMYVVDVDNGKLALLKLSIDGDTGTKLWMSGQIPELPLKIWLSISVTGEVVMSMSGIPGVGSEIVVMDPDGTPIASTARPQTLALGADLLEALSVTTWVSGAIGSHSSVPRASLGVALCGAPWLHSHSGSEPNPLAQAVACD